MYVVALGLAAAAFAVGISDWRLSVLGLLIYLPFSGIPIVLAYPNSQVPVIAKDFLFVLPAYVGFFARMLAERRSVVFHGAPVVLMGLLAILVAGESLNPSVPSLLVAAIGAKVWLLYIPLYFLAYHFVQDRRDLSRLLKVMVVAAVIPVALGLLEVALIYGGSADVVYRFYGSASLSATQGFTQFDYTGGGSLRRIPGTFSFVTQYYSFLVAMIAVSYAAWRGSARGTGARRGGYLMWLMTLVAVLLSGAREAFLAVPVFMLIILALEQPGSLRAAGRALGLVLAGVVALGAIGASLASLLSQTAETLAVEWTGVIVRGVPESLHHTWLGLGTGIATGASRYAATSSELMQTLRVPWAESWYAKTVLELGIAGLVVVMLLAGALVFQGVRNHVTLANPELRVVSAALLAFLLWTLVSGAKGPFLDLDPVNVYFWFFAGVLAKVGFLARDSEAAFNEGVE